MRRLDTRQALFATAMAVLLISSSAVATAALAGPAAMAGTERQQSGYQVDFNGCSSVNVVASSADDLPYEATITIYDADADDVERVTVEVNETNTKTIPGQYGDRPVYQFDVHEYVDEPESGDSKVLGVAIGDQQWTNENRCAENVPPENGEDDVDVDDVTLTAICTDTEDDLAKFRVTNDNDEAVTVQYDVYGTDQAGEVTVDANGTTNFTVETADDGSATVRLFYDDEQIDVKASNTQQECDLGEPNVDAEKLTLTAICSDTEDDLAKFRVTNDNDVAVTVEYDVYGTDQTGTLEVPANDEAYFTVDTADDGSATVRLFYDDEQVDVKASNTQQECDLGEKNEPDAYQVDLAVGEVIEDLGEDEDDFYGTQGRLLQARAFHENGTITGSHDTPWETGSETVTVDGCAVTYSLIEYDAETGEATVDVGVADDADCEGVQVTLAGYELPDGTTKFDRDRADEQELRDYRTVWLEPGESKTLVVDLDD